LDLGWIYIGIEVRAPVFGSGQCISRICLGAQRNHASAPRIPFCLLVGAFPFLYSVLLSGFLGVSVLIDFRKEFVRVRALAPTSKESDGKLNDMGLPRCANKYETHSRRLEKPLNRNVSSRRLLMSM